MNWCFSTLGCTEKSLNEILTLAKSFHVSAVEIRGVNGELDNRKIADFAPSRANDTKERIQKVGISLPILGTSCKFHDEAVFPKSMEEGYAAIDIASRMGIRAIRVFGNNVVGNESECIRRVGNGIRLLCQYAKDKKVDVLLETHGDFNTKERLRAVADLCKDEPNFGLIWDVCHTRITYGENWPDFCAEFFPLIRHVHLKDISGDTLVLPGKGDLPLVEMVSHLLKRKYQGYFSLEWERKWHPELPPIEDALSALVEHFKTIPSEESC